MFDTFSIETKNWKIPHLPEIFPKAYPEGLKTVIFYAFHQLKKIKEPFLLEQVADCMQQEVCAINDPWCDISYLILKIERGLSRDKEWMMILR